MKKILSLVLCVLMIASVLVMFTGCKSADDSKGAVIPIYVTKMPTNFDPAFCLNDTAGIAMVNLLFEGLFKYDAKGNVVKGLATGYKFYMEEGEKKLDIYIDQNAQWSDGTEVSANDFIYAWTRLLEPWNSFEAASMLFMVKNAKNYKNGTGTSSSSPSDLGFVSNGKNNKILTITFENTEIDEKLFLEYLASPALVPLPERKVRAMMTSYKQSYDWTTHIVTMESNGPFKVKSYELGTELILERNVYYKRNAEKSKKIAEKVTPYRLHIKFIDPLLTEQTSTTVFNLERFQKGEVLYNSYLPLAERQKGISGVKTLDTLTTFSLMFNLKTLAEVTGDETLDNTPSIVANKKVRQALSLAIDRQKIAEKVVYATPATGIVPNGLFNTKQGTSFRKVGGDIIASAANIQKAQQLLAESGIPGGEITIAVREYDEVAIEVVNEIKAVWEGLTWTGKKSGIKVKILPLGTMKYTNVVKEYEGVTLDLFLEAFNLGAAGKYKLVGEKAELQIEGYQKVDIFAFDMQALSSDPFSMLAPFARSYSGGGRPPLEEVNDEDFAPVTHRSGYINEQFEALIDKAFTTLDRAERAEYLHDAEEILVEDMVVAPIFVYKNGYIKSGEIEKVKFDFFGMANFTKALYKNYVEVDELEQ